MGMIWSRAGLYQPDRTKIKAIEGRWYYKHHIWNPAQQGTWVWASMPEADMIMNYGRTTERLRIGQWKLT